MTDIEQLAAQTIEHVEACFRFGYDHKIIIDRAISFAYTLGKHDAYNGQRRAAPENGKRGGRPRGSKDSQPRTRRSKAQEIQDKENV